MIDAYLPYGLESATWGFAAESSLHIMRMIMGGVFDRFPDLVLVAGHAGEGLPFWLDRIDDRYGLFSSLDKVGRVPQLERKPSEYIRQKYVYHDERHEFRKPATVCHLRDGRRAGFVCRRLPLRKYEDPRSRGCAQHQR